MKEVYIITYNNILEYKIPKELKIFLRKHNALKEYIHNLTDPDCKFDGIPDYDTLSKYTWTYFQGGTRKTGGFAWRRTKQGADFWERIDTAWRIEID